ncbi:hypothetical protein R4Z09_11125 [Niallia oryzisoli]|uniref:Uncharacterized protein n=1 Tax=Niallia oryzisoli TaxID=1737571 RepID=A0ABZ2CMC6_9BACI
MNAEEKLEEIKNICQSITQLDFDQFTSNDDQIELAEVILAIIGK